MAKLTTTIAPAGPTVIQLLPAAILAAGEHPALSLHRSLENLCSVCSEAHVFSELAESRKNQAEMRIKNLNDLAELDPAAALDAYAELQSLPLCQDAGEYPKYLRTNVLGHGLTCIRDARAALRAGGAKGLDAALGNNSVGQARSIELHTKLQELDRLLFSLMICLGVNAIIKDKDVTSMADVGQRLARIRDELNAVNETRGLDAPPALAQAVNAAATSPAKRKKRKRPIRNDVRPLTVLENNTMEVVGRHHRNFAQAAVELNRDPKTVRQNYDRAQEKLARARGKPSRSVQAGTLPVDRRGGVTVSEIDRD